MNDFEAHLRAVRIVSPKHIPYYVSWASRFFAFLELKKRPAQPFFKTEQINGFPRFKIVK